MRDWTEFVKAWLASSNLDDAAKRTGLSRSSVAVYATQLRKRGVNLPKFRRGRIGGDADVPALNNLILKSKRKAK